MGKSRRISKKFKIVKKNKNFSKNYANIFYVFSLVKILFIFLDDCPCPNFDCNSVTNKNDTILVIYKNGGLPVMFTPNSSGNICIMHLVYIHLVLLEVGQGCHGSDPTFDSDFCNMCHLKNDIWWDLSHIHKSENLFLITLSWGFYSKKSRP